MDELQELVVQTGAVAQPEAAANAEPPRLELTVEEIIEDHVGSLGFAQLLHVFFVSIAWVFDAQSTLVTIFSDAQPAWRCKASSSSLPACSATTPAGMCGLDRGAWEWVAGSKSSIIAEWDLVCGKRFQAGIPASLFFLGSLLGSAAHGRLADTYIGRKNTVWLSCLLASITAFLTALSPNIWVYTIFRFTNGFARSGVGICCLVLATEVVGRRWRGQVGQYGFFFFTVGFLSLPFMAYPARHSWRAIYKIMSLPPLAYSLLVLPFIAESPRWLAVMGRTQDALLVLEKFAKLNGRKLPPNVSISVPTAASSTAKTESLWSAKWATRRVLFLMAAGFGVGFVYYGVQLNVENLNFNLYFTVGVNALMEIPAIFLGSIFLSFASRRLLFSSSSYVTGAACFLCILFGKNTKSRGSLAQLSIEAIGFMASSMAFDILYVYCVELFPTNVRNFAVSMLRQALMLGAAIAPHLVVLGRLSPAISFVIFGGLSVFSGLVTIWLPETRNAPLCETLEQQEKLEKMNSVPVSETEGVTA
ncbi:organic cation/carnitine transporter 1-like [Zingiber officinale]|uniref:organic cation/carnitine transporter 1-like n=1 Tax=Zingiber officinale TaxID=94328 RepID=UPI001C4C4D14|nr:organic cation/carnitine transporter 1-like [Zingiber officinale]